MLPNSKVHCPHVASEEARESLATERDELRATIEKLNKERSPATKSTGSSQGVEVELQKTKSNLASKESELSKALKDLATFKSRNPLN